MEINQHKVLPVIFIIIALVVSQITISGTIQVRHCEYYYVTVVYYDSELKQWVTVFHKKRRCYTVTIEVPDIVYRTETEEERNTRVLNEMIMCIEQRVNSLEKHCRLMEVEEEDDCEYEDLRDEAQEILLGAVIAKHPLEKEALGIYKCDTGEIFVDVKAHEHRPDRDHQLAGTIIHERFHQRIHDPVHCYSDEAEEETQEITEDVVNALTDFGSFASCNIAWIRVPVVVNTEN